MTLPLSRLWAGLAIGVSLSYLGMSPVAERQRSEATLPSLDQRPFQFTSGVRYGTIGLNGSFKPYTFGEVRARLGKYWDQACAFRDAERCFTRAVETRLSDVVSRDYGEWVRNIEHGKLAEALGSLAIDDTATVAPPAREHLPDRQVRLGISLRELLTNNFGHSIVDQFDSRGSNLTLNRSHFLYGGYVLKPFLAALMTGAEDEPDELTIEAYESGRRIGTVTFADYDRNETVDEVTFFYPYEPVPSFNAAKLRTECAIYGDGLFADRVEASMRKALDAVEVVGLAQAPNIEIQHVLTRNRADSAIAEGVPAIDVFYSRAIEVIGSADRNVRQKLGLKLVR